MINRFALVLCAMGVLLAFGATPQKPKDVNIDSLTTECQKSVEPTPGMNLAWYVPFEFWEACMNQDDSTTAAEREATLKALRPYFMVCVVRADVSVLGNLRFHTRKQIDTTMTLSYTDKNGKKVTPVELKNTQGDLAILMGALKPILANALGSMGQNMHFYIYKNQHPKDATKRMIDPRNKGKLVINLAKTPKENGGTFIFETPLNSLFVPRKHCNRSLHISWSFCPFCGAKLTK